MADSLHVIRSICLSNKFRVEFEANLRRIVIKHMLSVAIIFTPASLFCNGTYKFLYSAVVDQQIIHNYLTTVDSQQRQ